MKQEKLIHPFYIVKIGCYFFAYDCVELYEKDMQKRESSISFVMSFDEHLRKEGKKPNEFSEFFNLIQDGDYIMYSNKKASLISALNLEMYEDVKTWRRCFTY